MFRRKGRGEIDIVVSRPLSGHPYETVEIMGQSILVETSGEIIAKKMYHRGSQAKARDLFDFAMVLEQEPAALPMATPYFLRHRDEFISQLQSREQALRTEFEAIDTLEYNPTFERSLERVRSFLLSI